VLLIAFPLLTSCRSHEEEAAPKSVVEVKTAQAEIADLSLSVQAPATIFPKEQANLASRIVARILRLNAKKGDYVAEGQLLAQLENHDILAQREEARAAIADAEASLQKVKTGTLPTEIEQARGQVITTKAALDQAQKFYERRKDLFEKGAIPQRDLMVSETELKQARANHEVAQRSLDLSRSGQSQTRGDQFAARIRVHPQPIRRSNHRADDVSGRSGETGHACLHRHGFINRRCARPNA
jgi:multidrug efflux pump subunit AcrA (membrane-fusion protein)